MLNLHLLTVDLLAILFKSESAALLNLRHPSLLLVVAGAVLAATEVPEVAALAAVTAVAVPEAEAALAEEAVACPTARQKTSVISV